MIFLRFSLNSYGTLKTRVEQLTRLLLMISLFQRVREVWGLDLYIIYPNIISQNSGRSLGLPIIYGIILCRTNIVRDIDLK